MRDPDPKSRNAAVRISGYPSSAAFVVTVIATPSALIRKLVVGLGGSGVAEP